MHFEGFIDYGQEEIEDNHTEFTDQLADHALVFIFRPYRSSWIQPITVFATKGAAPGHVTSRLLAKSIVVLEAVFARHPTAMEESERIWFLQDVPHLFKCVRNHIFSQRRLVKPRQKKPVKEKGMVSTKDPVPTSSLPAPASSLAAPASSLPATESSLPALASSLPAPKPYFIDEKIQVATSMFKANEC
ncbi:hypothetical protein OUZ56_009897 [Daphnia magna]|uniref:Transposable element P transposase-like RNase H domain-containing protein n=1 Tax=Daphnia magna TaxID=35525 RepID=A0ABR0AHB3_9CRUS|nr:hypothetical protein OUZ56_009897 [Daphnia magna]